MPYLALLAAAVVLGVFIVPVLLTQHVADPRAKDEFVSSGHVLPKVIQNSSIAYAIGLASLGPFFAQGVSGSFLPALIQAAFVGFGLSLIYVLRRPMLQFLAGALDRDRSITVHGFIAGQHGNDPRVGAVAAALTVCALAGFIVCVALGVAGVLNPMLSGYSGLADLVIAAVLAIVISCTLWSGHTGIMHAAQLQLGLLYLGLFGSTLFLFYQQVSDLGIIPARGNLAVALIAVVCAAMLVYRRGRHVDSNSLRYGASTGAAAVGDRESASLRVLRRFQKILNSSILILIFTTFGASLFVLSVSGYVVYVEGIASVAPDGPHASLAGSDASGITVLSLVLLPLFHPIVDIVNWQRIAVFEKDRDWSYFREGQWTVAFKSFCATYSVEVPLIGLLICLFGAVAGLTLEAPDRADVLQAIIAQLMEQDNVVAATVLSCLLFSLFAMAVATIGTLFSASLCALRYDIVPTCWSESMTPPARARRDAQARRWTLIVGGGIGLTVFGAFYLADARYEITFESARFLVLMLGFSCLQLALVPLVLGPLIIRSGSLGTVSPGWALAVMGAGAATGIGTTAAYLSTGYDPCQWAAVPGCLGSGALVFAIARVWLRYNAS